MVTDKVKETIRKNDLIKKGEHIVTGLSGGPDSVCLFSILNELKEELEISLHAVHINHKIRPGAAEEDQRYVEELCGKLGIPCKTFTFDINKIAKEKGISSEDAGRQARYDSFYQVAGEIMAETGVSVKIAVAQNMNDQAETLLMRIMRGTGTDGLAGIEYQRPGEKGTMIIRPLLDITRQEVEEYCRRRGLNPRIDLTNLEPIYTRNKIRLELLPYMRDNFNSAVTDALNRLSKIAKEDKDYFGGVVDQLMAQYGERQADRISLPVELLKNQHPSIRHRLILCAFETIGLSQDISTIHLEQADLLLKNGRTSASLDFSSGYAMKIVYQAAEFYKKTEKTAYDFAYELKLEGITDIFELNAQIGVKILRREEWAGKKAKFGIPERSRFRCWLSYDKIKENGCKPILRTRRPGDFIQPLGMQGKKKLQDFFVDEKIKREDRDRTLMLCLGSEVLWVTGTGRMNEKYKVQEKTDQIIVLEYNVKI